MSNDDSWCENSETKERNDENWKRRSRETGKKKIGNLIVGVRDRSEISGAELGKYGTSS